MEFTTDRSEPVRGEATEVGAFLRKRRVVAVAANEICRLTHRASPLEWNAELRSQSAKLHRGIVHLLNADDGAANVPCSYTCTWLRQSPGALFRIG
jgi:hypothetical protein